MAENRLELARTFSEAHPAEAANVIEQQPQQAGTEFLRALGAAASVDLFDAMMPSVAAAHLAEMDDDEAAGLMAEMSPQRAANVIRLLPPSLARRALDRQSALRRSHIQFYLRQAEGVIGAWIESNVVSGRANETVESLRKKFSVYKGEVPVAYIVDSNRAVQGTVNAAALVMAAEDTPASDITKPVPAVLSARTPIEIAVTDEAWRKSDILPVAESRNEFLGVVRYTTLRHAVDDLDDHWRPEFSGSSAMGLADAWFLGLSDILSASLARPATESSAEPAANEETRS